MGTYLSSDGELRILLVEDSAEDAELTSIELREAGLHVECRLVADEAGMRDTLATFRPHLIVSDLNLPGFSAASALKLGREYAPNARFIVFTGASESEQADLQGIDGWLCKTDAPNLPGMIRKLFHIPADSLM